MRETHFGDVVVRAVKPEVLNVALLRSFLLHHDARGVVRAQFVCANTYLRLTQVATVREKDTYLQVQHGCTPSYHTAQRA